jgi:site-specific recombinase
MASIESSSKDRRRTKSLKMKTTSLVNKASKISSSKAIEAERIITRDGFGYFSMIND